MKRHFAHCVIFGWDTVDGEQIRAVFGHVISNYICRKTYGKVVGADQFCLLVPEKKNGPENVISLYTSLPPCEHPFFGSS